MWQKERYVSDRPNFELDCYFDIRELLDEQMEE